MTTVMDPLGNVMSLTTPSGSCNTPEPYYEDWSPMFSSAIEGVLRSPSSRIAQHLLHKGHGLIELMSIWNKEHGPGYLHVFETAWKLYETFPKVTRASLLVMCMYIVPSIMNAFYKCISREHDSAMAVTRTILTRTRVAPSSRDKAYVIIVTLIWFVVLAIMGKALQVCFVANGVMATTVEHLQNFSGLVDKQYQDFRHDVYSTTECTARAHTALLFRNLQPVYASCLQILANDSGRQPPLDHDAIVRYLTSLKYFYNVSTEVQLYGTELNAENQRVLTQVEAILRSIVVVHRNCDDGGATRPFCNDVGNDFVELNRTNFNIVVPEIERYVNIIADLILQGNGDAVIEQSALHERMKREVITFFENSMKDWRYTPQALETEEEYLARHIYASSILGDTIFLTSWAADTLSNLQSLLMAIMSYLYLLNIVHLTGMTVCWLLAVFSAILSLFGKTQPSPLDKRSASTLMRLAIFVQESLAFQIFFTCAVLVFAGVVGERTVCDALRDMKDENTRKFLKALEDTTVYNWATQFPEILHRCNKKRSMFEVLNGKHVDVLFREKSIDAVSHSIRRLQRVIYPKTSRIFDGLRFGFLSPRNLFLLNETLYLPLRELSTQENQSMETLADDRINLLHALSTNFTRYFQALPNPTDPRQKQQQGRLLFLMGQLSLVAKMMMKRKVLIHAFNVRAAELADFYIERERDAAQYAFDSAVAQSTDLASAPSSTCLQRAGSTVMAAIAESMQHSIEHETGKCAYLGYSFNLTVHMLCDQIILPINFYWISMISFCLGFMFSMAIAFDLKEVIDRLVSPIVTEDEL